MNTTCCNGAHETFGSAEPSVALSFWEKARQKPPCALRKQIIKHRTTNIVVIPTTIIFHRLHNHFFPLVPPPLLIGFPAPAGADATLCSAANKTWFPTPRSDISLREKRVGNQPCFSCKARIRKLSIPPQRLPAPARRLR